MITENLFDTKTKRIRKASSQSQIQTTSVKSNPTTSDTEATENIPPTEVVEMSSQTCSTVIGVFNIPL